MTELTDIQLVLLSTACQREDGSLLPPPPETLDAPASRIRRAITQLITKQLAAELDVVEDDRLWRTEDARKIGVAITQAGRAAIAADEPAKVPSSDTGEPGSPATATMMPRDGSKQALVVDLMRRDDGASLVELADATQWLPHTTRAALSGLRKRGLGITNVKVDGVTRYCVATGAAK